MVGELDHAVWVELEPAHSEYRRFLGAYLLQAEWDWPTFSYFWDVNLGCWPTDLRKRSTSGLVAQRLAHWRRSGYSRKQIAKALQFTGKGGSPSVTRSIWELADAYGDWLAERPFMHPEGLGAMRLLEDVYAKTAECNGGETAGATFRRNYRRQERTPRVVAVEERWRPGFPRFGHPEEFSMRYLDALDPSRPLVAANLDRAAAVLREQEPTGLARLSPRRPHRTTAQAAA